MAISCVKKGTNNEILHGFDTVETSINDTITNKIISSDSLDFMDQINVLLESSFWFNNQREAWISTWQEKGDTIKSIVLNEALKSGKFSKNMYKIICINSENKKNMEFGFLHFGCYYYNNKVIGGLMNSFCKKDTNEIIKNLVIKGDSAMYITEFYNVLNEAPYNVDGFEWMSEVGEQGEKWLFAVHLVKEDGEWKIDKVDKHLGLYKE